jgi:uncharacterized OB-fold protein
MSGAGTSDTKASAPRPAPPVTELSEGFWQGVREGRLVIQRCTRCGVLRHYPQPMCPACRALGFDWAPVSGRGEIYAYTVAHRAFHPAWQAHVPYAIATIELEEGVRMVCDLLGTPIERVRIGARVEAFFEELPGQGRMPRFRLVESAR